MSETIESLFIDTIIDKALSLCRELPKTPDCLLLSRNIRDLRDRLAHGRLHIAVLGQFNRGKSSFINALLGMKILPTSVLPITSVPTVISFGETNECVISFSDKSENATVRGEPEEIMKHLETYVTEKNNPKNHFCVSEAIVRCKSSLLGHGTVLIDTPGFGSTFTHNTKTTLDLLAACDAALFLLSADLPITQVEVDFLESVVVTVPRLFFIYNKTDLLNKTELESSERFIKDTLIKAFNFSLGVKLFPVSAKRMEGNQKESEAFKESGLAVVEKEIIGFLRREKYFTLSEALSEKFKNALAQIIGTLEKSRDDILNPINGINEKLDRVYTLEKGVTNEMGKVLSLSEAEETSFYDNGDTLLTKKKGQIRSIALDRLNSILRTVSKGKHYSVLNSAFSHLFEEMFNRLFMHFVSELNKPMRRAAISHIRTLVKTGEKIKDELEVDSDIEAALKSRIEHIEIDVSEAWRPKSVLAFPQPQGALMERFYSPDKRYKQLCDHYTPLVMRALDNGLEELLKYINASISSVYNLFVRSLRNDYNMLLQRIKDKEREVEMAYKDAMEDAEPEISTLKHLIKEFSEVKNMVL